jgi:hypothetical protein
MTNIEVADFLRANVDWARFARLTKALAEQLNNGQLRFLKARLFEKAVEKYSNGTLRYVDENGCDFLIIGLNNIRLEMKYTANGIYTPAKGELKKSCKIKLTNSHGTNKHLTLPSYYADYLMFVSESGAILFDKNTLQSHIDPEGDGIVGIVPPHKGTMIVDNIVMTGDNQLEVDFIQQLDRLLEQYASNIL